MKSVYLYPGQLQVCKEATQLSTILGSCVGVALFDPQTFIGGLNHFLLPEGPDASTVNPRYGSAAMSQLVGQAIQLGAQKGRLQAKIFGGAAVMENITIGENIGHKNINFARTLLEKLKIPIVAEDVGGKHARRIQLNTATFETLCQHIGQDSVDLSGFAKPTVAQKVSVLIVDDSLTVRQIFTKALSYNPRIIVVGSAADPYQAREMIAEKKPDVMLLDIEMPRMNGVEFLEKVMAHFPIPTIMVSSLSENGESALRALGAGAIEFVHKPSQSDPQTLRNLGDTLCHKVLAAASIPVHTLKQKMQVQLSQTPIKKAHSSLSGDYRNQAILIGCGTGAQGGLTQLLLSLASDSPPIVVSASSIAPYAKSFFKQLEGRTDLTCEVATHNQPLRGGTVYFIPEGHHGFLSQGPTGNTIQLVKKGPVCSSLPSSQVMFQETISHRSNCRGLVGILLSGFGSDGVEGLLALREQGALTLVASPDSCPFPHGPQQAINMGAACAVEEPQKMAQSVLQYRSALV